jgi:hypothetical protein
MKKAAVDLLLLAQREKYLSLLRQVDAVLVMGIDAMDEEAMKYHAAMAGYRPEEHARLDANCEQAELVLQAVREALK